MLAKITRFNSRVSAPGTGSENNIPTDSSYSKADGNNTDIMNIIETSPDMPEYNKLEGEGCPPQKKHKKTLPDTRQFSHGQLGRSSNRSEIKNVTDRPTWQGVKSHVRDSKK